MEKQRAFTAWLDDHLKLAELLAASDEEKGSARLWNGENGDAATECSMSARRCSEFHRT